MDMATDASSFHDRGYLVLHGLLPAAVVSELHSAAERYIQQRGPRLLNVTTVFGKNVDDYSSFYIPDIRSEPPLRHLFQMCDESQRLQSALSEILGKGVRFLGRNELVINHFLSWHRDMLQGDLMAYTRDLDPWLDSYQIVAVSVFLQVCTCTALSTGPHCAIHPFFGTWDILPCAMSSPPTGSLEGPTWPRRQARNARHEEQYGAPRGRTRHPPR